MMNTNTIWEFKDFLHAQLCYQVFITPIIFPLEKEYRTFAKQACHFLKTERHNCIAFNEPRHHVLHHFAQPNNPKAKKILILHGWMSRAAYMAKYIRGLHQCGFDVYALDFPAHGEARGLQLSWIDAVNVLREVINQIGPFYAVIGHSFGGATILNTLNLAKQSLQWSLASEPERVILMSSPSRMRTPVKRVARQMGLSGKGFLHLREVFRQKTYDNLESLHPRHYAEHANTPILCLHGQNDTTIKPIESTIFCQSYPHAYLKILPDIDHINILFSEVVVDIVCNYLNH